MNENIDFMSRLSRDILYSLEIKVIETKTLLEIKEIFYDLMRKYGIKQGTLNLEKGGITCNNPEWTMARDLFERSLMMQMSIGDIMNPVPEDLKHY